MKMDAGVVPNRGRALARPLGFMAAVSLILFAAAAPGAEIALTVEHREGAYEVRGSFETAATLDLVWGVLTDYDRIPGFVESMKESVVEQRTGARLRVRQQAVVGVFPMRRKARLMLDVLERRPERIEFRDTLGQDFHFYRGAWDLRGDSTGTRVAYSLDAAPRTGAPAWLGRGMTSHGAHDLLQQVRAEIERRARGK
jgi:carbon monoxide dehydrogenase subunit G